MLFLRYRGCANYAEVFMTANSIMYINACYDSFSGGYILTFVILLPGIAFGANFIMYIIIKRGNIDVSMIITC